MATSGLYGSSPTGAVVAAPGSETSGLYGSSPTGATVAAPGSETAGLYGSGVTFGGTYFEYFIFIQSETQPATPTGGSWSFTTNVGTPPSGWSNSPPPAPTMNVWASIALVNSANSTALTWSVPGQFAYAAGLPILNGADIPLSSDGVNNQLYIQTGSIPQTIWFKEAGTWTRLTGSTLYMDLVNNQTILGTKTFSSQIQGSVSGTSSNVTGTVAIANGGTGQITANSALNALLPSQATNASKVLTTDGSNTSWQIIAGSGTVTSVNVSGGTTGLTTSGGPVTTSGTITLAGTLAIANGGTGSTSTTYANLASNVYGILPVNNGGTGVNTSTGSGSVVLNTNPVLVTPALGTPTSGNFSTGTFTWPTFNQNTTGTASNVTGVVAVVNGGTGATTLTGYVKGSGTSAFTASSTIPTTDLSGTITNAQLANSTISGVSLGSNLYSLTIGSGLTGTSYNGSAAVTIANSAPMVYPSAGIASSTGSAWNTSYSTTGTGTVLALATAPTLNNPTVSNYENWTGISAPTYTEGRMWYDSAAHALAYYNDSSTSTVHIGQDLQLKVINNTGSTIANGSPVYITGTSSGQTYPNIALAKADVAGTSSVIGLTNGAIANGAIGYVTAQGGIDNVNTGTFTVGQVLYLSPYSAGQLMNTIPPTGITVQVGVVSYVDASAGKIYVKQTTPLAIPASIITGQVAIANGGTGQSTAAAAFNALAPSQTGNSGKYLTTDGTNTSWAVNPLGTVTSVAATVPSFLSISGSPITTSGTLAFGLSGTALPATSGGTGLTSFTANGVVYASSTSALTTGSALTFDGSKLINTGYNKSSYIVSVGGIGTFESSGGAYLSYASGANLYSLANGSGTEDVLNFRAYAHLFYINSIEQMRLTNSGNLTLGVALSSWGTPYKVIQLGDSTSSGAIYQSISGGTLSISSNEYISATGPRYTNTAPANRYLLGNGAHSWYTAASGTAGSAISYTQAMTLDSSGNLFVNSLTASKVVFTDASKNLTSTGTVAVAQGGTGTSTPSLVAGTNISITGTWPNQTINSSNTGGTVTSVAASGGTTGLTFTGSPITTSGTLTLGGTLAIANGGTGLTSFTANGVVYASSSSALATGSALTFDGTNFSAIASGTSQVTKAQSTQYAVFRATNGTYSADYAVDGNGGYTDIGTGPYRWYNGASEYMRLTSTGLGIGTSSFTNKLQVAGNIASSGNGCLLALNSTSDGIYIVGGNKSYNAFSVGDYGIGSVGVLKFASNNAINMILDSSGNLGLGVTPSGWTAGKAIEVGGAGNALWYVGANDVRWMANSYYNGSYIYGASQPASYLRQASGAFQFYNAPSGTAGGTITFTQAMTLDASGQLALGRTSATDLGANIRTVDMDGTSGAGFRLRANGTNILNLYATSSAVYMAAPANVPIAFETNNTERVRIDSTGNLGIGTSSPSYRLDVSTNTEVVGRFARSAGSDALLLIQDSTTTTAPYIASYGNAMAFGTYGGTEFARFSSTGNLGLGVTPSAWASSVKVLQVSPRAAIWGDTSQSIFSHNMYTSSGVDKYLADGYSTLFTQQNGAYKFLIAPSGTAGNAITFTQAMTLDASGNLGIGTTSPICRLHLNYTNSSANINMSFGNNAGGGQLGVTTAGAPFYTNYSANGPILFGHQTSTNTPSTFVEDGRFDGSGNLLVGTTTSAGQFSLEKAYSGGTAININTTTSGTTYSAMVFRQGGSVIGSISVSSTIVSYNVTSDQRLKENIADSDSASTLIDSLQVRKFDWKADGNHQRYGFIAQELLTVAPEAVHQPADAEEMMAVDYSKLVPMLVKEIQSLRVRLAVLEAK